MKSLRNCREISLTELGLRSALSFLGIIKAFWAINLTGLTVSDFNDSRATDPIMSNLEPLNAVKGVTEDTNFEVKNLREYVNEISESLGNTNEDVTKLHTKLKADLSSVATKDSVGKLNTDIRSLTSLISENIKAFA